MKLPTLCVLAILVAVLISTGKYLNAQEKIPCETAPVQPGTNGAAWAKGTTDNPTVVTVFLHPNQLLEGEFLKLIEQLQPKPEYLQLFREIVLDVWKQRQVDAIRLTATLQSRLDSLKAKRQRVIDAFLHERSIDKPRTRIKLIC